MKTLNIAMLAALVLGQAAYAGTITYVADLLSLPAYTDDVRTALDRFLGAFEKVARQADQLMLAERRG